MPFLAVGDDVQEPLGGWHVVGVAGSDGFPLVAGRVRFGEAEGMQEPGFAVGAVVGQGLTGPLAGDQDTPPGVAEVFAAVRLASAPAWSQAFTGVLRRDAVAQPVGWRRSASTARTAVHRPGGQRAHDGRRFVPGGSRRCAS
jgi:hypothetical protein